MQLDHLFDGSNPNPDILQAAMILQLSESIDNLANAQARTLEKLRCEMEYIHESIDELRGVFEPEEETEES